MQIIFKNYLKTFIKNWMQTIGTVLFILMMCAIVIGMLTSPLQISNKLSKANHHNNKFDTYINQNSATNTKNKIYNHDFVYSYFYENLDYVQPATATAPQKQILAVPATETGKVKILSDVFKKTLDLNLAALQKNGPISDVEQKAFITDQIVIGMQSFSLGALVDTTLTLAITDAEANPINQNIDLLKNDLLNIMQADLELGMSQGYGDAQDRVIAKLVEFSKVIGAPINLDDFDNLTAASLPKLIDEKLHYFDEKVQNKQVPLLAFQMFSPAMYKILANSLYSYNVQTYINYQVFHNIGNPDVNPDGLGKVYNFWYNAENNYYLSKTTTDSLFPTFALELKNTGQPTDLNQLQIREGTLPTTIKFRDWINNVELPTIVLSSSYMKMNHIKVGAVITLPEGPEANQILNKSSTDAFLTNSLKFQVVGSGEKYDDLTPGGKYIPFLEDIKNYAIGYVDDTTFNILRNSRWNYATTNAGNFSTAHRVKAIAGNVGLEQAFSKSVSNNDGIYDWDETTLSDASSSTTQLSLNNIKIQVIIYVVLGVVVLILAFVFINFSIRKELNETRKQIGIFKSFGYKISELSWIFAVKTFISILMGVILGYVASIPLQIYSANNYTSSLTFSFAHVYTNAVFMLMILIVIPLLFLGTSYLLTLAYLREPTLSLLSNGFNVSKINIHPSLLIRYLTKTGRGFSYRLQRSFVRTSYGKFIIVQILFAFASLTFALMFGAQTIMYSTVSQGFSLIQKDVDHNFYWTNAQELNIAYQANKYNFKSLQDYEKRDFQYISTNGDQSFSDVLNQNSKSSDSRFRATYLIDSISNQFDQGQDRQVALKMVMPKEGYYDKYSDDPVNDDPILEQTLFTPKLIYPDYYLNWILGFKINDLTATEIEAIKNNYHFNVHDLETFVEEHPTSRLDLEKAFKGDEEALKELIKAFPNTLFGMQDNSDGLKNNLFIANITKIITLELFENYVDTRVKNYLTTQAKPVVEDKYSRADIDLAIAWAQDDKLVADFSPNLTKYWGIANNPLIDLSALMSNKDDQDGGGASNNSGGGLSLNKLSQETISLVMSAMMLEQNSADINQNPTLTINELFYDPKVDFLQYQLPVLGLDKKKTSLGASYLRLVDTQSTKYGDYYQAYSLNGVDEAHFRSLGDYVNDENTVNAIIPYGLAKQNKLVVGDVFSGQTDTNQRQPFKLKVVGINKNITFRFGGGWPIDVDYNQFRQKFFAPEVNQTIDKGTPIFNNLTSQAPMLTGKINLNDLAGSINSLKFVGNNLALSIEPGSSVFGSIFNGMINLSFLQGTNIDGNLRMITNPNIASISAKSGVTPYNIVRVGVDDATGRVNNVLVLFMILEAVLLLIILVVVMNIVVEEQAQVILTLRSLGYKKSEINWIVMGSYITGALISFIIAYLLSLLIWWGVLAIAANEWSIYIFMAFSWKAPVITFVVIAFILFVGWAISDWKVNRTPLAQVTSFG